MAVVHGDVLVAFLFYSSCSSLLDLVSLPAAAAVVAAVFAAAVVAAVFAAAVVAAAAVVVVATVVDDEAKCTCAQ